MLTHDQLQKCSFDDETHTYKIDGQKVPSVTQIINELLPRQYNPGDWYLERGKAVHACAAMIAKGIDFTYDWQVENQVGAIREFFNLVKPVIIRVEHVVHSKKFRFSGRLDLVAMIQNYVCIVDYKSSIDTERSALQLAGYSIALEEMGEVVNLGLVVAIKDDGRFTMSKIIKLQSWRREFLSLRTAYAVRERLNLNGREKRHERISEPIA